jgi:hypothetical protein
MMPRASFRLFRTGLIGSIVLGLASAGHLAGGGRLPEPAILAALCAVTLIPVAALTRFRLSLPLLVALLGAGQAWLHWAFSALAAGTPGTPATPGMQRTTPETVVSGHAGHAELFPAPETFSAAMPAHTAGADGLMFAAHALATLGTALLLARGEQALWALASWLRPLVKLPEPRTIQPVRVPVPSLAPVILPLDRLGRRLPSRRGPPAPVLAA